MARKKRNRKRNKPDAETAARLKKIKEAPDSAVEFFTQINSILKS